jgi:hypothetical protein
MAAPVETAAHRAEHGEPIRAVLSVAIDRLPPIAARGHVIQPAGKFNAKRSGHGPQHNSKMLDCKT